MNHDIYSQTFKEKKRENEAQLIKLMNYNDQDDLQPMQLRRGKSTGCTKIPQMDHFHYKLARTDFGI